MTDHGTTAVLAQADTQAVAQTHMGVVAVVTQHQQVVVVVQAAGIRVPLVFLQAVV
jgi:hypothetical protein